ncbi:MAG TPA: hypothetical protein VFN75_01675 [Pseudonocardiaceae bacterium]|nr:hypothetical protein [Pseudonocardiaceae bacterium]
MESVTVAALCNPATVPMIMPATSPMAQPVRQCRVAATATDQGTEAKPPAVGVGGVGGVVTGHECEFLR